MARYIDVDRYSFPTLHNKELNDYMKGWNTCLKSVLQQLTADVEEVKHGKWVLSKKEFGWNCSEYPIEYTCSVCGRKEKQEEPYCHCGAKMDGGKKDDL